MAHPWTEKYAWLYERTYRVLYDAGLTEEMADELATRRALTAALKTRPDRSAVRKIGFVGTVIQQGARKAWPKGT